MRYLILFISLICLYSCEKSMVCHDHLGLSWCIEEPTSFELDGEILSLTNKKDGLLFVADIRKQEFDGDEAIATFLNSKIKGSGDIESKTISKGNLTFTHVKNKSSVEINASNVKLIGGMLSAKIENTLVLIEYRAVNEAKLDRLITQLMQ